MHKLANKIYDFWKNNFNIKEFLINILVITLIIFIGVYKFPYVIYKPGGAIDLTGRIYLDNEKADLGSYNMAYVSVARGNLPNLLLALLIDDWDIKKEEDVTYTNTDYETTFKLEKIDLQNSINYATMLAYQKAGKDITIKSEKNIIYAIDSQANTNLKVLDEIIAINGNSYDNLENLREYINSVEVNEKLFLTVKEDDQEMQKYAYVYENAGTKIIGIVVYSVYEIETNPEILIKSKASEAGSSGGLMLSLAIYDSLISDDLTSGKKIMGTGTINENGDVGAIGGVKYKLLGAQKEKADIFFIPEENYAEAKKLYDKYKFDFELVMVRNFDDAINFLSKI